MEARVLRALAASAVAFMNLFLAFGWIMCPGSPAVAAIVGIAVYRMSQRQTEDGLVIDE